MALYLSFKSFLRKFFGSVQPGCAVKTLSVPSRHFHHFRSLAPIYFAQLWFGNARQIFVNGHQVVRFTPRRWESFLEKIIKRSELFQLAILFCAYLAKVFSELHKMDGIAEYRTGIFSWINNMVAAPSTVAGNLDLPSGMIAFVTSAHPEIRESEPSFLGLAMQRTASLLTSSWATVCIGRRV